MKFNTKTVEFWRELWATHLPDSPPFLGKNVPDANFYRLLDALSVRIAETSNAINAWVNNYAPQNAVLLVEEWEEAIGLPDACFPKADTIEERIEDILVKLRARSVRTAQDYEDLAATLGVTLTVRPYKEICEPWGSPYVVLSNEKGGCDNFTLVVDGAATDQIKCVFNKIKPAHVELLYVNCLE